MSNIRMHYVHDLFILAYWWHTSTTCRASGNLLFHSFICVIHLAFLPEVYFGITKFSAKLPQLTSFRHFTWKSVSARITAYTLTLSCIIIRLIFSDQHVVWGWKAHSSSEDTCCSSYFDPGDKIIWSDTFWRDIIFFRTRYYEVFKIAVKCTHEK